MEYPPLPTYIPPNPKKRVFPGGSSSCMDPEVVEIPPPANRHSNSKSNRRKEVIHHEVIDVDMDEDCGDVLLIDGKVDTNKKGKEALANFSSGPSDTATLGSMDGVQSSKKSCAPGSQNFINLDGFSSDFSYGDDEYLDKYCDDLITDDNYAILQSHFDNIDIPPGVEAPIPWLPGLTQNVNKSATALPGLTQNVNKSATASSSAHSILQNQSDAVAFPSIRDLSRSSWLPKSAQIRKKSTSKSNSSLHAQSKKDVTAQGGGNLPSGLKPFKSWQLAAHGKRKNSVFGGAGYYISNEQLGSMQSPSGMKHTSGSYFPNNTKHQVGMGSFHSSSYMPFGAMPGVSTTMSALAYSGLIDPFGAGNMLSGQQALAPRAMMDPAQSHKSVTEVGCSTISSVLSLSMEKCGKEDEILKKLQLFKKFDTVEDHSDHHYLRSGSSSKQPSKNWAKKIQEEWKILEKDLPDTIYVRVYESRMDLLRAVIVGAEGTPYHDGLFFFDVFFPSSYPNVPPHVYYHSGGLRINPNLYNCGKVCLSLLNTWNGGQKEKWIPGVSTMLQVLVSIQGLILNAKPFFNEPGYANMSGSASGEKSSLQYNENTFILSLKTMVYSMRRPPKHFEDLVVGHFCKCSRDILVACKAYMDGAQVGCLVRGGVQDVDEGDKSCSQNFKQTLAGHINMLVEAFAQVGAKGCERFLSQTQIRTG